MLNTGAWLGIDIGSSKSKVMNFCLIEVEGGGRLRVLFERGAARRAEGDAPWPANKAEEFLALERSSWASEEVELQARRILARSALVERWRAHAASGTQPCGAAVDAPCGFAIPGESARDTERHAATSFSTADAPAFVESMRHFAQRRNETPLQQRYFWKLVGLIALRDLVSAARLPFDASLAQLAAACVAGVKGNPRLDGTLGLEPVGAQEVRVREAFPSDTYARANGARGVLAPAARRILEQLAAAPWELAGNVVGRASSIPTADMGEKLLAHRDMLRADLAAGGPIAAMRKISRDPSWADLWDAFACAFASACEGNGAAALAGSSAARLRAEGAILVPESVPATAPRASVTASP